MTKTIELPSEVYEQLEKQARMHDLTIPQMVAQLIEEVEAAHLSAVVERMRAKGMLVTYRPDDADLLAAPEDFQPIQVQGKPLSEVIIEERR